MIESRIRLDKRRGVGRLLHLRHDDGEFVAAEAGDGVGLARAAAQAVGDQLEQFVADRMAERIVDALELIEIEAQHREALAALDALELVIQPLAQRARGWADRSARRGAPCGRCALRSAAVR